MLNHIEWIGGMLKPKQQFQIRKYWLFYTKIANEQKNWKTIKVAVKQSK